MLGYGKGELVTCWCERHRKVLIHIIHVHRIRMHKQKEGNKYSYSDPFRTLSEHLHTRLKVLNQPEAFTFIFSSSAA